MASPAEKRAMAILVIGTRAQAREYQSMKSQCRRPSNKSHGFTLLEVLVALLIMTLSVSALLLLSMESNDRVSYLKDRSVAQGLASNVITEMRLGITEIPALQKITRGKIRALNAEWFWQAQADKADEGGIIKVTVTVSKENEGAVTRLHLLMAEDIDE